MSSVERNAEICKLYQEGLKVAALAKRFRLGRQRIYQIIKAGGVWQPYEREKKTFLGVSVNPDTKAALKQRAEEEGVSVSELTSDALDAFVAPAVETK